MRCCVVIPVGPGHEKLALRAKASVQQAVGHGMGAFDVVEVLCQDDSGGLGRSRARNLAVGQAGRMAADWIFFLDADDLMHPHAFEAVAGFLPGHDAVWGEIHESSPDGQHTLRRPDQIAPISDIEQILKNDPFLTLQMGHFVRTAVAMENPFDEEMDCGEDFKYYLQIWGRHCCTKIGQPLFFNVRGQSSTGPGSASSEDWRLAVNQVFTQFCLDNEVLVDVPLAGRVAKFQLSNPLDHIQNYLAHEIFFETKELIETLYLLPMNPRVIDVGSNIGNHALFWSCIADAAMVHCFEPVQSTAMQLQRNFEINGIDPSRYLVDTTAIGSAPGRAQLEHFDLSNQGASRIREQDQGDIEINSLDALLPDAQVDLLKIDVEGMELDVLAGARKLIERDRPMIMVEVANRLKGRFFAWTGQSGYRIHRVFEMVNASNYLLSPLELRPGFHEHGTVACRQVAAKLAFAPAQEPCGWSVAEFVGNRFAARQVAELQWVDAAGWQFVEVGTQRVLHQAAHWRDALAVAGDAHIVLPVQSLGRLNQAQLGQLLAQLPQAAFSIVGIMDARWNHVRQDCCIYRDLAGYVREANACGFKLLDYQNIPNKEAFELDYQLGNEITILDFAK